MERFINVFRVCGTTEETYADAGSDGGYADARDAWSAVVEHILDEGLLDAQDYQALVQSESH